MKKNIFLLIILNILFVSIFTNAQRVEIEIFDKVLFYDGYNSLEALADEIVPAPEGVVRLKTSLITTKLKEEQLSLFGNKIDMIVVIKAACDNYDRIGNVNLALVPKGEESYNTGEVDKLEIGRFITPFMNKNIYPDTVPYTFDVSHLKYIFRDTNLLSQYDFWVELEVFGVPYAANTQVYGCAGRSDVFYGSLSFSTRDREDNPETENVLIPLFFKQSFNNYQEGATDELGQTIKSINFSVNENLKNAKLFLITSNHGANSGGEEYNRRWHYVYFNEEEVFKYKPGRPSCEPYRKYNTQSNGIYGSTPKTDAQWQSFSNWCPGDVIVNRIIELDELKIGTHTFRIEVPDAVFVGQSGNFPLSLFLLAKHDVSMDSYSAKINNVKIYPNPSESKFYISGDFPVKEFVIYNLNGQKLYVGNNSYINVENLPSGFYNVTVELENGNISRHKLIKQ